MHPKENKHSTKEYISSNHSPKQDLKGKKSSLKCAFVEKVIQNFIASINWFLVLKNEDTQFKCQSMFF
jgi:hypothetical protein